MSSAELRKTEQPILRVENLEKTFFTKKGGHLGVGQQNVALRAVSGVSFDLAEGETLGIVGESGCGKSTLARLLMRLETPTDGVAYFRGTNIYEMSKRELRNARQHVQMVFQDPYSSLNPRMRVRDIISEPWVVNTGLVEAGERQNRLYQLLERVGLDSTHADRYPHQFSGGQRQRIGIARALALSPDVLICDEPVSALDVSVQAQVINLLEELQDELGLAYIFIAHDLSVVRHIADRVAVMYMGKIVEIGSESEIYESATHPYTQALLSSVPVPDPDARSSRSRILLEGDLPDPTSLPAGCSFRTRCWKAAVRCADAEPELVDRFGHGHPSRCYFASEDPHSGI